jgi:protein FAM32A
MSTHIPGKLKLKGSKSSGKKKSKNKRPVDEISDSTGRAKVENAVAEEEAEEFLTEAQKKHEVKKKKMEAKLEKEAINATYRERVEAFNYKLSIKTEHNDIPRISAAGNG